MKQLLLIILIFVSAAAAAAGQQWAPGGPIPIDEYKFISEIRGSSSKADLVIVDRTLPLKLVPPDDPNIFVNSYTSISKLKKRFRALTDETVRDFNAKNDRSHLLENRFSFAGRYRFITSEQILVTLSGPGHPYDKRKAFRKSFPGATGYYEFSRVGFNAARDQALIYETYECGEDCGSSTFYFYIRKDGAWKLKGKFVKFLS